LLIGRNGRFTPGFRSNLRVGQKKVSLPLIPPADEMVKA